ncbi:MAG: cation transporter [Anaerolineae bacterium]|nr:cation transporter [Anaerolineae bacterium]
MTTTVPRTSLTRFAWLSIGAAVLTIGLKASAYLLTGSVGLLSDALESGVNLIAAIVALGALAMASRPADEDHTYGHDKIEYFSSGVEGVLILVAALSIAITSIGRLRDPQPLEQVDLGLIITVVASIINFGVSRILLRASKQHDSITLEADSHHLMTDVWTSGGVILGVLAVGLTGWLWLDPIIAMAVAINIVWSGVKLVRASALGLIDTALPAPEIAKVKTILESYAHMGFQWHALRTRQAGARRFVFFHVLVPGNWTVQAGHNLLEQIESDIRREFPLVTVSTHLEPLGDPAAMADAKLDREPVGEQTP